jgi:hypothetical protein
MYNQYMNINYKTRVQLSKFMQMWTFLKVTLNHE